MYRSSGAELRDDPRDRAHSDEAAFQQQVVDLARTCGWLTYHTHDSRRSDPGFPDLVLVRGPRIIFAELKDKAAVTEAQREWWMRLQTVEQAVLEAAAIAVHHGQQGPVMARHGDPSVIARIWRPADWPEIESELSRR